MAETLVKVESFNITTGAAGGTVAVTVGFRCTHALLFWSGRTESVNTSGSATHLRGFGAFENDYIAATLAFRAACSRDQDAAGTSICDSGMRADACITEMGNGAMVGWADVQSVSDTQVVFEILDQFTTDLRVTGIFFGGNAFIGTVSQGVSGVLVEVGNFTTAGTAPVQQVVSIVKQFTPRLVFLWGAPVTANLPAVALDSTMCLGVLHAAKSGAVMAGANEAAGSGAAGTYSLTSECFAMSSVNPTSSPNSRAEFVSFGVGSFTINWLERTGSLRVNYLAIGGGGSFVDDILTGTTAGAQEVVTGAGFKPKAGILISGCKVPSATDAAPTAHDEWSLGVFTSTTERFAQQVSSRNGNTTMFTQTAYRTDAIYANQDPATDAIEGLMDIHSIDADGVTLIMDDEDPVGSAAWGLIVLFGDDPHWLPRRGSPGQDMRLRR